MMTTTVDLPLVPAAKALTASARLSPYVHICWSPTPCPQLHQPMLAVHFCALRMTSDPKMDALLYGSFFQRALHYRKRPQSTLRGDGSLLPDMHAVPCACVHLRGPAASEKSAVSNYFGLSSAPCRYARHAVNTSTTRPLPLATSETLCKDGSNPQHSYFGPSLRSTL